MVVVVVVVVVVLYGGGRRRPIYIAASIETLSETRRAMDLLHVTFPLRSTKPLQDTSFLTQYVCTPQNTCLCRATIHIIPHHAIPQHSTSSSKETMYYVAVKCTTHGVA